MKHVTMALASAMLAAYAASAHAGPQQQPNPAGNAGAAQNHAGTGSMSVNCPGMGGAGKDIAPPAGGAQAQQQGGSASNATMGGEVAGAGAPPPVGEVSSLGSGGAPMGGTTTPGCPDNADSGIDSVGINGIGNNAGNNGSGNNSALGNLADKMGSSMGSATGSHPPGGR